MKVTIQEAWTEHNKETGEWEFSKILIWQGEANVVYFCSSDINIKQPYSIIIYEDEIIIIYPRYSNVRIEEKIKSYSKLPDLWCMPAMTSAELEKLKAEQAELKEKREAILS